MKEYFHGIDEQVFKERYSTDDKCLELLANEKWQSGFICKKCGNDNYCKGKTAFSRRCTRCKHDESATAHTVFHRCKLPIHKAFQFAYLICNYPTISSYELSRQMETRHMTCYSFKKKITECIKKKEGLSALEKEKLLAKLNEKPAKVKSL